MRDFSAAVARFNSWGRKYLGYDSEAEIKTKQHKVLTLCCEFVTHRQPFHSPAFLFTWRRADKKLYVGIKSIT